MKMSSRVLYWILGVVVALHLLVFTDYTFAPHSLPTLLGETLKAYMPFLMLSTLFPWVYKFLDKVLSRSLILYTGLVLMIASMVAQVTGVLGQAWSTLAFSIILIISLYNYLTEHYTLGHTKSIVLSFLTVFSGWIVFETVFQIGLWLYHPESFGYSFQLFMYTMRVMAIWIIPPIIYFVFILLERKVAIRVNKYFYVLIAIALVAVVAWFATGMLIPLPVGSDGLVHPMNIQYLTLDHLFFSVSRASQIAIMGASALIYQRKQNSD